MGHKKDKKERAVEFSWSKLGLNGKDESKNKPVKKDYLNDFIRSSIRNNQHLVYEYIKEKTSETESSKLNDFDSDAFILQLINEEFIIPNTNFLISLIDNSYQIKNDLLNRILADGIIHEVDNCIIPSVLMEKISECNKINSIIAKSRSLGIENYIRFKVIKSITNEIGYIPQDVYDILSAIFIVGGRSLKWNDLVEYNIHTNKYVLDFYDRFIGAPKDVQPEVKQTDEKGGIPIKDYLRRTVINTGSPKIVFNDNTSTEGGIKC